VTAAVTLLAKERKIPEILYQVLFYPVTDANFDTASYLEFTNGPWLTRPAMVWFWDAYAPKASDRKEIAASPLQATTEQLAGLPPALIIIDENDVLRDEGEAYAQTDRGRSGCHRSARPATFHDLVTLNPLAVTPATRAAIRLAANKLSEALSLAAEKSLVD
jgi:acetyl esterase